MNKLVLLGILWLMSVASYSADLGYRITQQISLGSAKHWDYAAIDNVRKRLFVTLGDHVEVVNIATGKRVATIADTKGAHGVAFAQDLKLGFISNGHSSTVTVFDLDTLQVKTEIKVPGNNPDAIMYEQSVHKVYVFNGDSENDNKNVEVIDAKSLTVVASIKASGSPEFAVSGSNGKIYFNIEEQQPAINVIDVATNKVIKTWPFTGCKGPTGLAIDTKNMRLFSSCRNGIVAVTDARTGKRITQFAIGKYPDAVIYDPINHLVFVSAGEGNGILTIAHQTSADHYTVMQNLETKTRARTMAMSKNSKAIYLPTAVNGNAMVVVASPSH